MRASIVPSFCDLAKLQYALPALLNSRSTPADVAGQPKNCRAIRATFGYCLDPVSLHSNMVAVQQIATESQAVVQAVVDRVYIHCTRLHNRQAVQRVELASQQQQWGNLTTQTDNNLLQIQCVTGTVRKVRRELKNCVRMETLESALDAVYGRLKSLEYAFNLLPTGLAFDQFVNHVVAISRQPAATPKRQPLKRKHQNMCLTPVRRSPRIAGTPLYEMDANLLR